MEMIVGGCEQGIFGETLLRNKNRKTRTKLFQSHYLLLSHRNLQSLAC